jgi:WXG100 family type VII secretion target
MGDSFHVDLDELDATIARLANYAKMLSDHLGSIDAQAASLVSTSWSSDASDAYAEAHREWVAGAEEFARGVDEMKAAARHAHERYSAAHAVNSRMLR